MLETVMNSLCPSQVREELDRKKAFGVTLVENREKRQSFSGRLGRSGKSVMTQFPARSIFPILP
jgi:hypothetical protein